LIAVDDALSVGDGQGLGVLRTMISIGTAPFALYSGSFTLTGFGPRTLRWWSEDVINNVEVTRSSTVFVDNSPPSVKLVFPSHPQYDRADVPLISNETKIEIHGFDAGSGLGSIQYRIDPSSTTPYKKYESGFQIKDDGKHVIIRPLAYVGEHDLAEYASQRGFPIIPCNLCGSQDNLQRQKVREMMADWDRPDFSTTNFNIPK
jgi:hypothetical protein